MANEIILKHRKILKVWKCTLSASKYENLPSHWAPGPETEERDLSKDSHMKWVGKIYSINRWGFKFYQIVTIKSSKIKEKWYTQATG